MTVDCRFNLESGEIFETLIPAMSSGKTMGLRITYEAEQGSQVIGWTAKIWYGKPFGENLRPCSTPNEARQHALDAFKDHLRQLLAGVSDLQELLVFLEGMK